MFLVEGPVIIILLVFFGLIVFLCLKSYLKSQIHILELLVTLVVGQFPALFIIRWANFDQDDPNRLSWTVVSVVLPLFLVLAGSLWGLACARKLDEQRTWSRLGMMAAGWGLVCGIIGILPFCATTVGLIGKFCEHERSSPIPKELIWTWLISLCAVLLAIPGVRINERCMRQLKNPS